MMRRQVIVIAALFASLVASAARAQDHYCDGDFVVQALDQGAAVYRVAVPKAFFHAPYPKDLCRGATPDCRLKTYVIAKDRVLVSSVENGWACAWYPSRKLPYTAGWLRASDLTREPTPDAPINWLGVWSFGPDTTVAITRDKRGGLRVSGDTVNTGRPSMPSGGFEGALKVNGSAGVYSDYDAAEAARYRAMFPGDREPSPCVVKFRRVDRYLIANDDHCSGMGATFMGVYERER